MSYTLDISLVQTCRRRVVWANFRLRCSNLLSVWYMESRRWSVELEFVASWSVMKLIPCPIQLQQNKAGILQNCKCILLYSFYWSMRHGLIGVLEPNPTVVLLVLLTSSSDFWVSLPETHPEPGWHGGCTWKSPSQVLLDETLLYWTVKQAFNGAENNRRVRMSSNIHNERTGSPPCDGHLFKSLTEPGQIATQKHQGVSRLQGARFLVSLL